jgi:hypothetical protein
MRVRRFVCGLMMVGIVCLCGCGGTSTEAPSSPAEVPKASAKKRVDRTHGLITSAPLPDEVELIYADYKKTPTREGLVAFALPGNAMVEVLIDSGDFSTDEARAAKAKAWFDEQEKLQLGFGFKEVKREMPDLEKLAAGEVATAKFEFIDTQGKTIIIDLRVFFTKKAYSILCHSSSPEVSKLLTDWAATVKEGPAASK